MPPAEEARKCLSPRIPRSYSSAALFALALLAALYVAAEIAVLVLAVVLNLLLQPVMRVLERWHIPRIIAALLLILRYSELLSA